MTLKFKIFEYFMEIYKEVNMILENKLGIAYYVELAR